MVQRIVPGYSKRIEAALTETIAQLKLAQDQKAPRVDPFHLPAVMPGVLPRRTKPSMAMDQFIGSAFGWASGSLAPAAFAEGQEFLGYPYLSILAQRPEYRVIFETIAGEMTRKWIKFKSKSNDDKSKAERIKQLDDDFKRLKVQDKFRKCAELDGAFGRSHLYIDLGGDRNDREEMQSPIGNGLSRISKLKCKKGALKALRPVEPVWTYPTNYNSIDPLDKDWYDPEHWFVMGRQFHRSRLLRFVGREVPDMLKPAYSFGGLSISQMVKPYVDNWLNIRQNVANLVQAFSIIGLKTNLSESLQLGGNLLFQRIALFNSARNNANCWVIDKNDEEFWNVTVPLSTLDALQAQAQEHMAAIARIPLVKLLGIQPLGLNASSEGEIRTFYDSILEYQESLFRPNLTVIMHFAMLNLWGEVDEDIEFKFEPLWSLDEKAMAEVNEVKARTGQTLVDAGIVSQEEERRRLANDPDSGYDDIDVDEMPELKEEEEEGLAVKGAGGAERAILGEGGEESPEEGAGEPRQPGPTNPAPRGEKPPGEAPTPRSEPALGVHVPTLGEPRRNGAAERR